MPEPRTVVELAAPPNLGGVYARAVRQRAHGGDEVPEQVLRLRGVVPDVARVAAYADVCGERLGAALPPLFPHVLGFPLQLGLLTDARSPFRAMGLVHVANAVEVLRPVPVGAALDVEVEMAPPVPHRKGRTVELLARASVGDELAWRSSSTYLHRGSGWFRCRARCRTSPCSSPHCWTTARGCTPTAK